jgi:hypothetical protein
LERDNFSIYYLSEKSDYAQTVSTWLFNEFSYLVPGITIDTIHKSVLSRLNTKCLPLCLIALKNNELVGTVSLKPSDLDIKKNNSPWLTSLYVSNNYEKRNI